MAQPLDLQEQEQLDDLKAFWKTYGNLITWALVAALAVFAALNGWKWWQREQSTKAAAMYDELDRAAQAGNAQRAGQIFADLKQRYPRTVYAEQGGLLAASVQFASGQSDQAKASLDWVAGNATEDEYQTVARLRLAGLLLQAKDYDAALNVLLAQGKPAEARGAYQTAWQAMDAKVEYRRLIEAKLSALGAAPGAAAKAAEAAK